MQNTSTLPATCGPLPIHAVARANRGVTVSARNTSRVSAGAAQIQEQGPHITALGLGMEQAHITSLHIGGLRAARMGNMDWGGPPVAWIAPFLTAARQATNCIVARCALHAAVAEQR